MEAAPHRLALRHKGASYYYYYHHMIKISRLIPLELVEYSFYHTFTNSHQYRSSYATHSSQKNKCIRNAARLISPPILHLLFSLYITFALPQSAQEHTKLAERIEQILYSRCLLVSLSCPQPSSFWNLPFCSRSSTWWSQFQFQLWLEYWRWWMRN